MRPRDGGPYSARLLGESSLRPPEVLHGQSLVAGSSPLRIEPSILTGHHLRALICLVAASFTWPYLDPTFRAVILRARGLCTRQVSAITNATSSLAAHSLEPT